MVIKTNLDRSMDGYLKTWEPYGWYKELNIINTYRFVNNIYI